MYICAACLISTDTPPCRIMLLYIRIAMFGSHTNSIRPNALGSDAPLVGPIRMPALPCKGPLGARWAPSHPQALGNESLSGTATWRTASGQQKAWWLPVPFWCFCCFCVMCSPFKCCLLQVSGVARGADGARRTSEALPGGSATDVPLACASFIQPCALQLVRETVP